MKKLWLIGLAVLFVAAPAQAQFSGSGHDFSDGVTHYNPSSYDTGEGTWNVGGEDMCTVCHNAHTPGVGQPLWFHKLSTTTSYVMYDAVQSETFDGAATVGQPTGTAILCLSCHDGTVGVDQYGWGAMYAPADPTYTVPHPQNGDLSHAHPISFVYDDALATADGFLVAPSATALNLTAFNGHVVSGSLEEVLLDRGQLQCSSCHDVHNKFNNPHSLNIPKSQDQICTTCHAKG
jgi:predicted CXXCH cytochrome family protein